MLWAASLLAEQSTSVYYQLARLQAMSLWWHWLLLLVVCAAVTGGVALLYYFDSVELPRATRWLLLVLRLAALVGILFYFLDLEKRSERRLVKNSRILMLVDTSQSMGLTDTDPIRGTVGPSRIAEVVAELAEGSLLTRLRRDHDIVVYRFDQGNRPVEVTSLATTGNNGTAEADDQAEAIAQRLAMFRQARWTAIAAGCLLGVCLVAACVALLMRTRAAPVPGGEPASWAWLVSIVALLMAAVLLAVTQLRSPEIPMAAIVGLEPLEQRQPAEDGGAEPTQLAEKPVDWNAELLPRGAETRLGEALRYVVNKERGGPIAGIVIFSDGRSNAGVEMSAPLAAAQAAGIPLYTVGLGSDRRPINVRVVDLEAPPRVYPGDRFNVTGYVQAYGLSGRTVRVQLVSQPAGSSGQEDELFEDEQRLLLGDDGEVHPLRFEVLPDQQGLRVYKLRVEPPNQDYDVRDNEKTAKVEVVQRKNRVLLVSGGPTREYRFLRNLLFRDDDTDLHVLLQSGGPGISQEADELLFEFPATAEELFEYDCIIAFDPDWQSVDDMQLQLLDRWVAEGAGGLIVIAGPIFTPQWSRLGRGNDPGIDIVQALYPVVFYSRGSATLSLGRFEADTAWPLQFTREGMASEFLWLEDESLASEQAWASFGGVYGYYAVRGPKPGARVLTRFADPTTALDGELPIYMATHFYGAGRVFFQASGEMWRIRALDDAYFERYYTKLIRYVSEGRLLRDSSRGVLLVDKDRCLLGDRVGVRAILTDPQHRPLLQDQVNAVLVQPDGGRVTLPLEVVRDAAREGMYTGQFTAMQEGDYRIELPVPQSAEDETLTREVRVRVPTLEIEQPERNDALLQQLAQKTGGQYYVGVNAAVGRRAGLPPLANVIEPQDQVTHLPGTPDKVFELTLMAWLMGLICGALCLEWLVRRLSRLA